MIASAPVAKPTALTASRVEAEKGPVRTREKPSASVNAVASAPANRRVGSVAASAVMVLPA